MPELEPSHSRISPLAFALVIGATVGFAAGYGVGAIDRSGAATQAVQRSAVPVVIPPAPTKVAPSPVAPDVQSASRPSGGVTPPPPVDAPQPSSARSSADAGRKPSDVSARPVETTAKATAPAADRPGAALLIRSTPGGAAVFVDGREYGRTPVTVRDLARGAHRIRLAREGFTTEERRVTVGATASPRGLTLRLAPSKTAATPAAAASRSQFPPP